MLALILLAALQDAPAPTVVAVPPRPIDPGSIATDHDYPVAALEMNRIGIVSVLVRVSAKGRATDCAVTEASPSDELNQLTCRLFLQRARFVPARDTHGTPVDADYRSAINWTLGQKMVIGSYLVDLQVNHVPSDYRQPANAALLFDHTGRVTECTITLSSGSAVADRTACDHARRTLVLPSRVAAVGDVPAAAWRSATVRLFAQPPTAANPQPRR